MVAAVVVGIGTISLRAHRNPVKVVETIVVEEAAVATVVTGPAARNRTGTTATQMTVPQAADPGAGAATGMNQAAAAAAVGVAGVVVAGRAKGAGDRAVLLRRTVRGFEGMAAAVGVVVGEEVVVRKAQAEAEEEVEAVVAVVEVEAEAAAVAAVEVEVVEASRAVFNHHNHHQHRREEQSQAVEEGEGGGASFRPMPSSAAKAYKKGRM